MRRERCLNLACGDSFLHDWINLDYAPAFPSVEKANLLGRLPLADGAVDVVYSSHFIEHIPRERTQGFLKECFRVLSPGGKIRLVCPDLEGLSEEYLRMRKNGEHGKAGFVVLEMLDQCVRTEAGGELAAYYRSLLEDPIKNSAMIDYVQTRTGENLRARPRVRAGGGCLERGVHRIGTLLGRAQGFWCRFVVALLPKAFREQNVSFARVGERHTWIYDFYTIAELLEATGFRSVQKMSCRTSSIRNFPVFPLDVNESGGPRKGRESMYVEAVRP